MTPFE
jgi:hypothetical protein